MVTWFSCMISSRADWVLGLVRLISSASTIWFMMLPRCSSCSPVFRLNIVKPVMSEGSTSGVNWMRLKVQPRDDARAEASVVLPRPGMSSMSTWPEQTREISR